MRADKD
ncbi:hypothetical protein YPPY63_1682, partial [Yersinia pestis PY-63]